MENKEPLPTEQVTTTEKKTKPKDPGRIAAGKKLAEHNKKAREAKKSSKSIHEAEIPKENKDEIPKQRSFSLKQILSVVTLAREISEFLGFLRNILGIPRKKFLGIPKIS